MYHILYVLCIGGSSITMFGAANGDDIEKTFTSMGNEHSLVYHMHIFIHMMHGCKWYGWLYVYVDNAYIYVYISDIICQCGSAYIFIRYSIFRVLAGAPDGN